MALAGPVDAVKAHRRRHRHSCDAQDLGRPILCCGSIRFLGQSLTPKQEERNLEGSKDNTHEVGIEFEVKCVEQGKNEVGPCSSDVRL